MKLLAAAFATSLLVIPACVVGQAVTHTGAAAMPQTPAPVKNILDVRPFTLARPYRYDWSQERLIVTSGVLVVLEVDPALVVPRDSLEPVLYAGDVPVQRLNHGNKSGRVIAIIPGNIDLATAPIWFGSPQLPARVTAEIARSESARAEKAGVRPFGREKIASVSHPPAAAADVTALLRDVAAQLVYQYSPQEKELADQWRLPVAKAPTGRKP
jgi:hypothetical protein